jgi:hypothetical protein
MNDVAMNDVAMNRDELGAVVLHSESLGVMASGSGITFSAWVEPSF